MAQIIRRSLRARRPTSFHAGDVVELKTSNGDKCTGMLTYRLTEDDEIRNSKWIVTLHSIHDDSTKDMELQERQILRLVDRKSGNEPFPLLDGKKKKVRQSRHGQVVTSSDSDTNKNERKVQYTVATKSLDRLEIGPKSPKCQAKPEAKSEISERERRRMRREALMEEEQEHRTCESPLHNSKKKRRYTTAMRKSDFNVPNMKTSKKRRVQKNDPSEECTKVKMKTGTLYLYRGLNRRAVFVRRY